MILIITHREDFTVDFVVNKLNERGIKYHRFNCEDVLTEEYCFEGKSDYLFSVSGAEKFESVWYRRIKLPKLKIEDASDTLYILRDYEALLTNIFMLTDAKKWLSHPSSIRQAENKIYQLRVAKSLGFKTPDTIVTNKKTAIKSFLKEHNLNAIIKPLVQGRLNVGGYHKAIYTTKVDSSIFKDIESYEITPCIFQQYIEKEYELRVTVVNNQVFAAKVDSQKFMDTRIDWRRKKIPFTDYVLPISIAEKCLNLVQKLNLSFGAIDLVKSKTGDYFFLEINPNGQWAWLEMELGLNISDEIIAFLTNEV